MSNKELLLSLMSTITGDEKHWTASLDSRKGYGKSPTEAKEDLIKLLMKEKNAK